MTGDRMPRAIMKEQPACSLNRRPDLRTKADLEVILAVRESELIDLQGHCDRNPPGSCKLHWRHRGPCDLSAEYLAATQPRAGRLAHE